MELVYQFDPVNRQNALSCRLFLILQQMFNFNVSYITQTLSDHAVRENSFSIFSHVNETIDIYLRPRAITGEILDVASPIEAVFSWRFGFILRRKYDTIMRPYYALPFSKTVWFCTLHMTILMATFLYLTRRWERHIFGISEYSFFSELFLAIGVVCQHYLPTPSLLWSRRIAYFFYVIFAYITHSFYTSNLLSYIVTDTEGSMDIKALVQSDYELRILENMKVATERRVHYLEGKMNMIERELSRSKVINISAGLEAVRTSKTALLCDYPAVQSFIARTFDNDAICELEEVDIFSNVKMYYFAAKEFRYTEKLKIGFVRIFTSFYATVELFMTSFKTLRLRESGIIKRLINSDDKIPVSCVTNTFHARSQMDYVVGPLLIILFIYIIACLALLAEIIYYERYKVWPYVE